MYGRFLSVLAFNTVAPERSTQRPLEYGEFSIRLVVVRQVIW